MLFWVVYIYLNSFVNYKESLTIYYWPINSIELWEISKIFLPLGAPLAPGRIQNEHIINNTLNNIMFDSGFAEAVITAKCITMVEPILFFQYFVFTGATHPCGLNALLSFHSTLLLFRCIHRLNYISFDSALLLNKGMMTGSSILFFDRPGAKILGLQSPGKSKYL